MLDSASVHASALDALARRIKAGDQAAFHELILAVHVQVRSAIAVGATSTDMLDELLQQTFVTCFERIGQYEERGTLLAWLKGIARNHLRSELRNRTRLAAGRALEEIDAAVVDVQLAALDEADDRELTLDRLRGCLERLRPDLRRLVQRHHLDGLPVKTIARSVHRSAGWVAVTLFRLRRILRDCMTQEGA